MSTHEWTPPGMEMARRATDDWPYPSFWIEDSPGEWLRVRGDSAMVREMLRLAHNDREREIFVAELIGALGLDREEIDRGPKMVGNVVLEEVRRVAGEPARIRRELIDVIADHREAAALSRRLGAEMDRTEREIGNDEAFTLVLAALYRIIPEPR